MTNNKAIKSELLKRLKSILDEKIKDINQIIFDTREAMTSDTKSSAGDKFETGPEMIQLEINKSQAQLEKNLLLKKSLSKIDENICHTNVEFGSIVSTNQGNYFISAPMGEIEYNNKSYYALSIGSPIGKVLIGKQVGDEVSFQNRIYKIESVD